MFFYLPKMADDMILIYCFKPDNSSITGLSAASASSALFNRAAFSVSQPSFSALKCCFSYSIFSEVVFNSILALDVSACWVFTLAFRSFTRASFSVSSACDICKDGRRYDHDDLRSPKHNTSIILGPWGLMSIAS